MKSSKASHTYYRECQGQWRCPLEFRITDRKALLAALGWANALSVMAMVHWPRWLGRFFIETSVDYRQQEVLHTTCFRWMGLPLMTSDEVLSLHDDGESFALVGEARSLFAPWRRLPMEGSGRVLASAMGASYTVSWLGTQMRQTTRRDGDTVTLTQMAEGFEGIQRLERIGPLC